MQEIYDKTDSGREIAYVMITCESGSEPKVIEDLRNFEEIKEILCTFGSYDISWLR